MDRRTKTLESQEWEQPFDAEPFDSPDEWEYRGLMNTGGGVMCRIWRHNSKTMELLYNMISPGVAIIGAKYSEEDDRYIGDLGEVIDSGEVDEPYTESDKQTVAKRLLEEHA